MLVISDDVRLCEAGGMMILLDLRKGRYVQVSQRLSIALNQILASQLGDPRDFEAERRLIDLGYCREGTVSPPSATLPAPDADSMMWRDQAASKRYGRVAFAIAAILVTRISVRIVGFHRLLTVVRWIGKRYPMERRDEPREDITIFAMALSYVRARHKCLPDAIALHLLLRRRGYPTKLVLAVRSEPFEAHAWVQTGRTVLGDARERASIYRPIMNL